MRGLEWKKGYGVDSQSQSALMGLEFGNPKKARMGNGEAETEAGSCRLGSAVRSYLNNTRDSYSIGQTLKAAIRQWSNG